MIIVGFILFVCCLAAISWALLGAVLGFWLIWLGCKGLYLENDELFTVGGSYDTSRLTAGMKDKVKTPLSTMPSPPVVQPFPPNDTAGQVKFQAMEEKH